LLICIVKQLNTKSQLASLDAAIKTAADRLAKAQQAEAEHADKAAAKELLKELERFRAIGRELDTALAAVSTNGNALYQSLTKMHSLGSAFPSGQQLHSLGHRCLLTAIAATPWKREFELVPPRERRSFTALIDLWAATIETNVGAREKQTDEVAA
jgi:hypothetical protein